MRQAASSSAPGLATFFPARLLLETWWLATLSLGTRLQEVTQKNPAAVAP